MPNTTTAEFEALMAERVKGPPPRPAVTLAKARNYGPRHKPGVMNKLEFQYSQYLDGKKQTLEIVDWRFEGVTLIIAEPQTEQRVRMTLDFFVVHNDGTIELVDVKGFADGDSWIKLKMASSQWPWFRFSLVTRRKGQWVRKEV